MLAASVVAKTLAAGLPSACTAGASAMFGAVHTTMSSAPAAVSCDTMASVSVTKPATVDSSVAAGSAPAPTAASASRALLPPPAITNRASPGTVPPGPNGVRNWATWSTRLGGNTAPDGPVRAPP